MVTVGVAPLIGLDHSHLRNPRRWTEARWCLNRQHGAHTWLHSETIWLCKACSPSHKDSTRIRGSYRERDHSFVVYVCQVLFYVICQTISKRDRLPFTPTLGLSLNKREKDQSLPGTQVSHCTHGRRLVACQLWVVTTYVSRLPRQRAVSIYQWGCDNSLNKTSTVDSLHCGLHF